MTIEERLRDVEGFEPGSLAGLRSQSVAIFQSRSFHSHLSHERKIEA